MMQTVIKNRGVSIEIIRIIKYNFLQSRDTKFFRCAKMNGKDAKIPLVS